MPSTGKRFDGLKPDMVNKALQTDEKLSAIFKKE
jgi:hypothetical protein